MVNRVGCAAIEALIRKQLDREFAWLCLTLDSRALEWSVLLSHLPVRRLRRVEDDSVSWCRQPGL